MKKILIVNTENKKNKYYKEYQSEYKCSIKKYLIGNKTVHKH